ncbi:MAG: FAD-dependent oxidoreductase [Deltaproteobacteria bacterium]|nr:FAD-dependent oxidoreductase [Deltaproteobacteria bacterium]
MAERELKRSIPSAVDVVVVGGGLGGLSCAVELARQGFGVYVLEQHRIAGGYAHSFVRKGYHFDVSLHYLGGLAPGSLTHGILGSIGVLDKLGVRKRETVFTAEFPDFSIVLPNDRTGIVQELARQFPSERDGLAKLFAFLQKLKLDVIGPTVDPDFDVQATDRLADKYAEHTFGDVLSEFISDPGLLAVLGQLWMYIGLPPSRSNSAFSTCVFCSSFIEGSYEVEGGGTALVRAMVERLREFGGECLTRTKVSRILTRDGAATGVELSSGEVVAAKVVVSNANPYQTFFELLPKDAVSRVYRYRLEQMESSLSAYSMYLGLDCPPEKIGVPPDNYFKNHAADCDDGYRRALDGDIERTDWSATRCDHPGQVMFPEGAGVLSIAELAPTGDWLELDDAAYIARKAEVQQRLLSKYEGRFPGLEDHIAVMEFATPRTMQRFTLNHDGAIYGLAQTVEQSGRKRLRSRSPLSKLFLTGAWTWSGGGYEGAIMTGMQTAKTILQEIDAPRPAEPVRLLPDGSLPSPPKPSVAPPSGIGQAGAVGDDEHYRFKHQVMVFGDDMNSRGFADVSSYFRFLDRGRVEAIETICRDADLGSWLDRFVVNVYRIEAVCATVSGLADLLEVRTGLRKTSTHRAAFDQRIFNETSGDLVLEAAVEVLFLDENRALVPVPSELPTDDFGGSELLDPSHAPAPFGEEQMFPFRTPFRVYYEDTDAQGITYHVAYVRFCERALFHLVRTVWPEMSAKLWMSESRANVARFDIRYLNASSLGDRLEVASGPLRVTNERLIFGQRILFAGSGKVVADAVAEIEFRDEQEQPMPIPQMIVDASREFLPPDRIGEAPRRRK